ncbi:MAG: MBL fold metallo-hydrolase [Candidatus Micrarchaeota archaeon]
MLDQSMNYIIGDQAISLDGNSQRICYVSHAHSDHTKAVRSKGKEIIASDETIALCGKTVQRTNHPGIKLVRSGHVFGSTQFVAEEDGGVFVYTGDFKLEDGLTTKGAEIPKSDYLLIEGTFGSPEMVFPNREEIWGDIAKWTKEKLETGIVIFGTYSVGKSQEIIGILNQYAGVVPFTHEKVSQISSVYNQFGANLKFISLAKGASETPKGNFAAVVPQNLLTNNLVLGLESAYGKRVYTALATGWALKGWGFADRVFPLSDHADFEDILSYVNQSSPKKIFCCHGNERVLARVLKEKGYDAMPVRELSHKFPQMTLLDSAEKIVARIL